MFDAYFCPRVVRRLESSANSIQLKAYVADLDHRGHTRLTIQAYVAWSERFNKWLRRRRQSLSTINEATVRKFTCRHGSSRSSAANTRAALHHLLRVLRTAGLCKPSPKAKKGHLSKVVAEYDCHLQSTCGLAAATRLYRRRYARHFLEFVFQEERIIWRQLTPKHVQSFIATYANDGHAAAARVASTSLRNFFRWLQFRGINSDHLVGAVPGFRDWRWIRLPVVMTEDQQSSFLAVFDQSRPNGCRDYAMALCMVSLVLQLYFIK